MFKAIMYTLSTGFIANPMLMVLWQHALLGNESFGRQNQWFCEDLPLGVNLAEYETHADANLVCHGSCCLNGDLLATRLCASINPCIGMALVVTRCAEPVPGIAVGVVTAAEKLVHLTPDVSNCV